MKALDKMENCWIGLLERRLFQLVLSAACAIWCGCCCCCCCKGGDDGDGSSGVDGGVGRNEEESVKLGLAAKPSTDPGVLYYQFSMADHQVDS